MDEDLVEYMMALHFEKKTKSNVEAVHAQHWNNRGNY